MIKVLLVDDHPVIRQGMRRILTDGADIDVAGEADSGHAAIAMSRETAWDVVVLDMYLPDMDGLETLKQLKLDDPKRPVLILTVSLDGDRAIRAIKAGAAGYLGKDSSPEEIREAVHRVAGGRQYIPNWLAERLAHNVGHTDGRPPHSRLSDREFEVLVLLASGRSAHEIAEQLALSVKTVSTYRTRVLQKLDLRNNAELAVYAIRHQLLNDGPTDHSAH